MKVAWGEDCLEELCWNPIPSGEEEEAPAPTLDPSVEERLKAQMSLLASTTWNKAQNCVCQATGHQAAKGREH
jgi:hypothetical protein